MKLESLRDLKADLWVFDNDGTLYPNPKDIEKEVVRLMVEFIAKEYSIDIKSAVEKRKELLKKHNTKYTLIAIKQEGISEDDFLKQTYLAINPADFGIVPSSELRNLIGSLVGEKIVFTNNPSEFAELILEALGINHLFSRVIGIREMDYVQKPEITAFEFLNGWLADKKIVVYVDNCPENIKVAESLGCTTLLIGEVT